MFRIAHVRLPIVAKLSQAGDTFCVLEHDLKKAHPNRIMCGRA